MIASRRGDFIFALVKGNGNHNVSCRLIGRFEPVADHFVDDFGVSAIIDADGRDLFKPRQARAQAVETHDVKVGEHASDVHDEIVKPLENFVSDHVVVTEKVAVTGGDLFVQKVVSSREMSNFITSASDSSVISSS